MRPNPHHNFKDYDYLQQVVAQVREKIGISNQDVIDFRHLTKRYRNAGRIDPRALGQKEAP